MIKSILIYMLTIIITVIFSWLYQKRANTKIKKIIYFILIIAAPVIVSTFRYNVGIDFQSYRNYYDSIEKKFEFGYNMPSNIEYGYILLNIIAKIIFNNAQGAFFLSSLLFVVFSIGGIIKFKDKISMPIATLIFMTFFYSASFNAIRQLIAVSIIFFALTYVMDRKFWKYLFFVLLATAFHQSAIICIAFYFLVPRSEKDIWNKDTIFNLCIIACTFAIPVLRTIIEMVCRYFNFYTGYFSTEGVMSFNFLLYIIPPLILILLYRKTLIKSNYKNIFFIRLMILQIPLQFLGCYVKYIDRMSLYAAISQIIIMPLLVKCTNRTNSQIIKYFIIIWYVFYYCIVYVALNGNGVYPYNYIIGL